jgi:hypothetical protein
MYDYKDLGYIDIFLNIFIEVTKLQPPPTKSETFPAYDTHNGPCHDGERP